MKSKQVKNAELESLRSVLSDQPTVVICSFEGLNVAADHLLRKRIREAGARYRVAPNRLARLASQGTPYENALSGLRGMTSLAFGGDDPIVLLKALVEYRGEHPAFKFRAGVIEGRELDVEALNELAKLPGREGLYAKLLYLLNAPAQRLLSVINAPARDLAIVVKAGVEEKKFSA